MKTKPRATINMLDSEIQDQIDWSSSGAKKCSDLDLLDSLKENPEIFGTFELNRWVLDGSIGTNISNVAFMSSELSLSNCKFGNVWVEADLQEPSSFYNTTIQFGCIYPYKIKVDQFLNGRIVDTEIIDNIGSSLIYTKHSAVDIDRMRLTFLESRNPFSFAYLQSWLIGSMIVFDESNISSLILNEDTDPISNKLEIDTADIEVYSDRGKFNILTPTNIASYLKKGTRVEVSVDIDDEGITDNIFLGNYYIDKIEFRTDVLMKLCCESGLGILDRYDYVASPMCLGDVNAKELIDSIFETVTEELGLPAKSLHEVEDGIDSLECYGYIPKMSCREALKQVCFVNGLEVLDNRNSKILIRKTDVNKLIFNPQDINNLISKESITSDPQFEFIESAKAFTINKHSYEVESEYSDIGEMDSAAVYIFQRPVNASSIIFDPALTAADEEHSAVSLHLLKYRGTPINVQAKYYNDTYSKYRLQTGSFDGRDVEVSDCKMVTQDNVESLLKRMQKYYHDHAIKLKIEYISKSQKTGDVVNVELIDGGFVGVLVHQRLDVSGGMVASAEILGSQGI